MTQPDAKLAAKWEERLRKHGLGVEQPITDNSEGEMSEVPQERDEFTALRQKVDVNDRFMEGHQISKVRMLDREIPEWALNDDSLQRLLLSAFPKLKSDKKQRQRAGMYARLAYLYYRMRLPKQIVAKELKISNVLLTRKIQTLSRFANGQDNKGRQRVASPLKQQSTYTSSEGTERKGNEAI